MTSNKGVVKSTDCASQAACGDSPGGPKDGIYVIQRHWSMRATTHKFQNLASAGSGAHHGLLPNRTRPPQLAACQENTSIPSRPPQTALLRWQITRVATTTRAICRLARRPVTTNLETAVSQQAARSPLLKGLLDFALFDPAASVRTEPCSAARKAASAASPLTLLACSKGALSPDGPF